jgi:thiamine-monophosphate kinase
MRERQLIEYVRRLAGGRRPPWLPVGIGDDAAVVAPPGDGRVVLTTDMLIAGTHFLPQTPAEQVGYKAVARCLSDLAAMASRPLCTLAAIAFGPEPPAGGHERLVRALWETGRRFGAPLIGGDVSSIAGPLTLAVTALGTVLPPGPVLRSGARPGDALCVTGRLGGSLRGRHLTFVPRVDAALELAARCPVHAMIDVSDGLSTDALHIAEESRVGLVIEASAIPVSEEAGPQDALRHALDDGEDYELLFCVPPRDAEALAASGLAGVSVSVIGRVTDGPECALVHPGGAREPLRSGGWEHRA